MASAWNVPHISFLCGSAELLNKNLFETFLRIHPGYDQVGQALVQLAELFGWQSVGVLFDEVNGLQEVLRVSLGNVLSDNIIRTAEVSFHGTEGLYPVFDDSLTTLFKITRG